MRIKKKKKTFAERAYKNTHVDADYTQIQITKMLEQLGITNIRITREGTDYSIEFIVRMRHDENPRKIRMTVPFNTELGEDEMSEEQRKNAIFRVLYWQLKSKFVSVQNNLKELEEEFLADLVISHNGREVRLGDIITPRYKEQLKHEKIAVFSIKSGE